MKEEIIKIIESIENPKVLRLVYGFVKEIIK